MRTHVLLDFDGVVLQSQRAQHFQFSRSVQFMHRTLRKSNKSISLAECARANARMYPVHGHTVHVLNKEFGADVTLAQYNQFVFGREALVDAAPGMAMSPADVAQCDMLVRCCKELDTELSIFTNSHPEWVRHTVRGRLRHVPVIHPDDDATLLKPSGAAYARVNSAFPDDMFVFVDDSKSNCDAAREHGGPRWIACHFETDIAQTLVKAVVGMYT